MVFQEPKVKLVMEVCPDLPVFKVLLDQQVLLEVKVQPVPKALREIQVSLE